MQGGVAVVVVAAGRGTRVGGDSPKQYRALGGAPVIGHTLRLFADHPEIGMVQPVIHRDDIARFHAASAGLRLRQPVFGGATRQISVRAGLEALEPDRPRIVLVHDAARPFASPALISRAIAAGAAGAAIPGLAPTDTIKAVDAAGRIVDTLDRGRLRAVQTPQAFGFDALLAAHRRALAAGRDDFTDDAALAEWAGMAVHVFAGESANIKLTTEEDFARVAAAELTSLGDIRTATGYDVHSFGAGDHVWLGGVRIPHDRGLTGYSDADAPLHALVDAILGALADGDIGSHFPPGDPQWKGASSDRFLAFAAERVAKRGGRIAHLDITIICETPRIGPHRDAMRTRIAAIAGVDLDRVAVKATTNEKLGFIGRGEGIAAMATATVRLPAGPR
ncbi:MAG TPA: bifunctional 2-C-methyl-D-erythritol 4-phosphate cytidylyltransferase/2-C-methyl-D-erythritol 2,4-cyclodiphosphate synthase [Xanthobacteraceae bacterium]|jgi:2-C-methyl-D-erythritol 4-phosphate cytidylyltransferase/2-C-methyl-D-erythritol 2,4-cyclodiphosphate synthase|nr:bifunctional 2-C-methyl-D-erythritol 4-phosphate cytidylyltransferase/2-C-methyl-D-erythritol 2,4-cyclodiphosphate synthase [Xanthobacteraceae bacterium]